MPNTQLHKNDNNTLIIVLSLLPHTERMWHSSTRPTKYVIACDQFYQTWHGERLEPLPKADTSGKLLCIIMLLSNSLCSLLLSQSQWPLSVARTTTLYTYIYM